MDRPRLTLKSPPQRLPFTTGTSRARRQVVRRLPSAGRNGDHFQADPADTFDSAWSRFSLAQRELDVAIAEEDYATAARLRDAVTDFEQQLSPQKQLLVGLLQRWRTVETARERATTLQALGDLGDEAALPLLQTTLADPELGSVAEASMWSVFMRAPTPALQAQMDEALALMARSDTWPAAIRACTEMIQRAPSFAEAYNKRATVLYLMERYRESIADCKMVLELNSYHFGAASGMGICCARVKDYTAAIDAFQLAMRLNPRLHHLEHHVMQLQALEQEGRGGEE